MKKYLKGTLAVITAIIIVGSSVVGVAAADRGQYLKDMAASIANQYREMGFDENSAAIRLNQLIWAQANGQITSGSYLYDSTTGQKYWLGSPNTPTTSYGSYGYGSDYYDGQYLWYFDGYYLRYYRFDRDGNKIWADKSGSSQSTYNYGYNNGGLDTSAAWTTGATNPSNYNYTYKNVKLYAGRIYGLRGIDSNEVDLLAKLTNSYAPNADVFHKAAFMWSVMDLKGSDSMLAVIQKYYSYYDYNTWIDDDMRELAREIIFRKQAEKSMTYVGRVLPTGYSWVVSDQYGIFFRKNQNGENYTFPNAYSTTGKSQYHSPY